MNDSLSEMPFTPALIREENDSIIFIYNGFSMSPLFKAGDVLRAYKSVLKNIRLGDIVIVYRGVSNTAHFDHIVHRVVSLGNGYLITQGDNNLKPDEQIVTNDNLVRLVTSFRRDAGSIR